VFHNASQADVYDLYARDAVQGVTDGINGGIMTYGQTGSGKTFTMMGDPQSYEHRGVAPRAIGQLFNEINSRIEIEFKVTCTYMEIYNERVFDLLMDLSSSGVAPDYTIVEEKDGKGTFVRGLTEVEIKSENEALNLLFSGELTRTTAQHKLNRKSNRSHSIFTIYLQQRQRSGVSERVTHSKLHLVDLAGSERLKKTMDSMDGVQGADVTKKESMAINQSLTYLEQCVIALARKGSHVPYRQSRLTNILKDILGANCNTLMIACIWGEAAHLEETTSTLRLASRMMRVQNETSAIETIDSAALIKKQAKIIKALKQELLMHDALVERTGVGYDPYTPEQQKGIASMLEQYVAASEIDEEDILNINSFRQMLEVCKQFKKMVLNARADTQAARAEAMSGAYAKTAGADGFGLDDNSFAADTKIAEDFDPNAPTVGEFQSSPGRGFALGQGAQDSRPAAGIEGSMNYFAEAKSPSRAYPGGAKKEQSKNISFPAGAKSTFGSDMDFNQGQGALFETYIRAEGSEIYQEFSDAKAQIKEIKHKSKDCAHMVNEAKASIDQLQLQIENRKYSRIELLRKSGLKPSETEDIVDEEEFRLMKELREAKQTYKNNYEQLQKYKSMISQIQGKSEQIKNELANSFMMWNGSGTMNMNDTFDAKESKRGGDFDQLDDQEAFDRLEVERVMSNDPDSLAFFNAQKTKRALMTQNSVAIKTTLRNRRH